MNIHLNSGPNDDTVVALPDERDVFYVAKRPAMMSLAEYSTLPPPLIQQGLYQARLDEFGQYVPHDLESVEFDWRGWL